MEEIKLAESRFAEFYGLWLLVFIRLLCPVGLESRLGIIPSREESTDWLEQLNQQAVKGLMLSGVQGMAVLSL